MEPNTQPAVSTNQQMKVDVQTGEHANQRVMTIEVDTKDIDKSMILELQKISQTAKVDGFQPGKVPLKVVQQKFGAQVRQDLLARAMQENFEAAIKANDLKPAGLPNVDIIEDSLGKPLIYKTTFDVIPQIDKVDGLDKIKVEKIVSAVTDEDLEQMLETMRKQHAEWINVEREAQNEDRLTIDFEGFMDGEKFENGSANDVPLVLGSNYMIEGFEAALEGVKAGEERELNLTFPTEYHVAELAGKPVQFQVTVKEVAEPKLPEIDQDFAEKFNVTSIDKLRVEVRSNMERELEFALKDKVKNQVMDTLVDNNNVEIPDALMGQEVERLKQQAIQQMGLTEEQQKDLPPMPEDVFKEQAQRRVALGIILSKVVEDFDLKPNQDRVKAMVEKLASVYEDPDQVVEYYYQNPEQMLEVEQAVLEEQVVEKLLEQGTVEEKEVPFFEVIRSMGPQMPATGAA